jgi:L-fucose mutarotase/ribose pyranase (RbsD/FucU family)
MESFYAHEAPLEADWRRILRERLPLFGHRNWIVVADAAYPAQASPGVETVVAEADPATVLEEVLAAVGGSHHVRPVVYTDRELRFVAEDDAPGVDLRRRRVAELTAPFECRDLPHEEIISLLDRAGAAFRVLIVKTGLAVPYTSVFLYLDCAYWDAARERKLRRAAASGAQTAASEA